MPENVQVSGVSVSVRTVGSGPPVLFIHGLYVNDRLWDEVVARVSSRRTCVLPTLPLGAHPVPVGPAWRPSLDDLAGLVTGLLESLDLDDATVVGNDTGGGLVLLALGSEHQALRRVGRLVLTNCDSFDHFPPPLFGPLVSLCHRAPAVARILLRLLLSTGWGRRRLLASVVSGDRAPYLERLFDPAAVDEAVRVTAAMRLSPRQRRMDWLETITVPVELVWGDRDAFFPMADAERLHRAFPHAILTRVAGARTYVPLDDPDAVAKAILGTESSRSA